MSGPLLGPDGKPITPDSDCVPVTFQVVVRGFRP